MALATQCHRSTILILTRHRLGAETNIGQDTTESRTESTSIYQITRVSGATVRRRCRLLRLYQNMGWVAGEGDNEIG
ncbi:hypothetical protein [Roseiconus lacunae]|uniref:Uncharacterized protein n=1 Tax=Roseiconus lacunae TaxID=2605694 RepID=A0ABT7PBV4_9BACT|nr:hypothetical protein [Roseiconus lacunae]MDM4013978.1 hypothetical protein [Roseiconus lacunae]